MTNLQPISHYHLITISLINGEIFKAFTLRSGKVQGCPLLFSVGLKILGREIGWEKEIKQVQIENEEVNISLLTDVMILFIRDPRDSSRKLWIL